MKSVKLAVVLLFVTTISAFAQKSDINVAASQVKWTGSKIGGSHHGEIKIKDGFFDLKNGEINGGKVVIDMNTLTNTDLEDAEYNQKLVGHLKSDDFFGVSSYPTSTFEVVSATPFKNGKSTVTGKLKIKENTETITFDVIKTGNKYTTQLKVDRSKFDVRYGSDSFFDNLGDNVIDDIFVLDMELVL